MTAVKTDRVCGTASPGQAMGHCVARSGSLHIDTSSAYGRMDNPDTLIVTGYVGQQRYSIACFRYGSHLLGQRYSCCCRKLLVNMICDCRQNWCFRLASTHSRIYLSTNPIHHDYE